MDQQQGERGDVRQAGQFAPGHGRSSTEWMQNRHWITDEGRAALAAADLDRVRGALAGDRR